MTYRSAEHWEDPSKMSFSEVLEEYLELCALNTHDAIGPEYKAYYARRAALQARMDQLVPA